MKRRDFLAAPAALPFAGGVAAAAPQGPDLANLHDTLAWISRSNAPRLSFLDGRSKTLEDWKREARPLVRSLLAYNPPAKPLRAEVASRREGDGFVVEQVKISATEAYDIPAWVLVPEGRKGRLPAVVAIHCHGGCYVWGHEKILSSPGDPEHARQYRQRAYGRAYTEVLARRGFVVLVIDGFYFGSRRLQVESIDRGGAPGYMRERLEAVAAAPPRSTEWFSAIDRAASEYEHLTAKTIFTAAATWPGMLVWDDMRSVDYLASRPDVDPGRIGCVGLSIGGLRTAHLIAADPRIKAACVAGWMTQFGSQLRNHLRHHTWMIYVPGLYSRLDLPDAAALTAPGALFVLQCSRDSLYPMSGMEGAVEKLRRIYAKAGIPERFRGAFYDVPHSFTPAMQEEAFDWLEKWL